MEKTLIQRAAHLLFEMGQLRREQHSGWTLLGTEDVHSVAEHSLRAAQIAYVIAVLEGSEHPERVCAMLVFHDMTETRTRDAHKVASRYIPEIRHEQAVSEQLQNMGEVETSIRELWDEIEHRSTPDGIIAKDADYLEMAFSGKEFLERGFVDAQDWLDNVGNALKTESAKQLFSALKETRSTDWWKGLKKLKPTTEAKTEPKSSS